MNRSRNSKRTLLLWTKTQLAAGFRSTLAVFVLLHAAAAGAALLQTPDLQFTVAPESGRYEIIDKRSGVVWHSNPFRPGFAEITCVNNGKQMHAVLAHPEMESLPSALQLTFHPLTNQPDATLRVHIRAVSNNTLDFSYDAAPAIHLQTFRLLDRALWTTSSDRGYVILPIREGLLIPADSGRNFTQSFDTYAYEGCHMQMFGVVRQGSAALVTWDDPYVAVELQSSTNAAAAVNSSQILAPSLVLRKSAHAFHVQFLGAADYNAIGKAYRDVAREKGLLVPWTEKLKSNPARAKLFGASNYKLWSTLSRQMNPESTAEQSHHVNWTFAEAAQVAEHLKNDLQLERVLFIMGGWIHRGYDNQHPDILPTAPECGGDPEFAACAKKVRQLGYVFCLHDNYQDIYRDSPSWDERWIMKLPDGTLAKGGHWAGGAAYLTCSQMALELAQRPQNLSAIKSLSLADAYFIDTTYAAGLQECFDKQHPLTRRDDIQWKQALSDYARQVFGIFGSECGREWAIPHSDFFEGLTGVSGAYYHNKELPQNLGAAVVPMFELVYRDTIAMYGKYGYNPARAAEYVLHHISIGRPLNYHSVPGHLYWKQPGANPTAASAAPSSPLPQSSEPDPAIFLRADHGWADHLHPLDRFVKNTHEILSPLNELTAQLPMSQHQFLTADRKIQQTQFGSGENAVTCIVNMSPAEFRCRSAGGGDVLLPPNGFLVESPVFVAFCALAWNGVRYDSPALFTIRSTSGEPIQRSRAIRVFHGFGGTRIRLGQTERTVERESLLPGI